MTGLGTGIASALATAALAVGGLLADDGGARSGGVAAQGDAAGGTRTALVIDAGLARDGRELVDPRLRALDAELRLPRTVAEAETDLRYFAAQGYRLVVAGPDSRGAAQAAGVDVATVKAP